MLSPIHLSCGNFRHQLPDAELSATMAESESDSAVVVRSDTPEPPLKRRKVDHDKLPTFE